MTAQRVLQFSCAANTTHNRRDSLTPAGGKGQHQLQLPSLQKKPAAIRNHRKSIWCGSFRTLRGKNHVQVRRACVQLPYRGKLVRPTPQKSSPTEGGTGLDCSPCSRTEQPRNVRGSPDRLRQRRRLERILASVQAHPHVGRSCQRIGTRTKGTGNVQAHRWKR